MLAHEKIIADFFHAWIEKNLEVFAAAFDDTAVYIESWGPAYRNKAEITKWFSNWVSQYNVLKWDIKRYFHQGDISICEWYFECKCNDEVSGFDGVSIIEFDDQNKIRRLKEFKSEVPNYYPYE